MILVVAFFRLTLDWSSRHVNRLVCFDQFVCFQFVDVCAFDVCGFCFVMLFLNLKLC